MSGFMVEGGEVWILIPTDTFMTIEKYRASHPEWSDIEAMRQMAKDGVL